MRFRAIAAIVLSIFVSVLSFPQSSQPSVPTVPRQLRFGGTVKSADGTPRTGVVGVMFSLYSEQQGGTALWTELQNVQLDANGQYSVLLGSQHTEGVPAEIFTTNEARWLGIQVEAEPEQPRVLLVSVPYALKAGDAETLGGKSLSSFLLNPNADASGATGTSTGTSTTTQATSSGVQTYSVNTSTSGGTAGYIAKWIDASTLGNSLIYDNGTNLGIGTNTPTAGLDIVSTSAPASGQSPEGFRAVGNITVGQTNNFPQNSFSSVYSGSGTQGYIYGLVNYIKKTGTGPLTNAYGVLSSVQNTNSTGAISNAYAFVAQAPVTTGPITNSYAFYAEDPNSLNYFAGKVGIGTNTPTAGLDIVSTSAPASGQSPEGFRAVGNITVGQTNNFPQNSFSSVYSGSGTQGYIYGLVNYIKNTGTGSLTNAYGVLSSVQNNNPTGTIANAYAFVAQAPVTTGPITNSYAFYAEDANSINFFNGKVGIGTSAPGQKLTVIGTIESTSGGFKFPDGTLMTSASNITGTTNYTGSTSDQIIHATQNGAGAGALTIATLPSAVRGDASASTGFISGVLGSSASPSGFGVFGENLASSGNAIGTFGVSTTSTTGTGVWGEAEATTGDAVGVYGKSFSTTGTGIFGYANATSGDAVGVYGRSDSILGTGAWGNSTATSGVTFGVYGSVASASGTAGVFDNAAAGDLLLGRQGITHLNVFRVDSTGKGFFNGGTQTGGADFAESVEVLGKVAQYEAGDVMAIDPAGKRRLALTNESYSTRVAGIYSTKPGVLASPHGMDDPKFAGEIPLALVGIVPCKVSAENGPIKAGDLLVSASIPGYAMKGTDRTKMAGAVVGKALDNLDSGTGVIQVLVSLQ